MAILEVIDLHKSFGKTEVLKGISFSMEPGQVLSIIGSSGSGKTTLLRCINFLETADRGKILLDGDVLFDADGEKLTAAERRALQPKIGLVFQQFNLFPQYNVLDNVTLAVKLRAKKEKNAASRKAMNAEIEEKQLRF